MPQTDMSRVFDSQAIKRQLYSATGISRCLRDDFDEMKAGGGLWGGANEFLITVVNGYLVGISDHLDEILAKARKWIEVAMSEKEVCGGYPLSFLGCEHRVTWAVCNWLRGQPDDLRMAGMAADFENEFLKEDSESVSDTFALGLGSLAFVEGRRYSEYLHWAKTNGKIPLGVSASRIRGEASVCTAICLARTEGYYSEEDIAKIIHRLLNMHMNDWLTTGKELRAVRWLKLAYWQDGHSGLTPREIILKAYEHLPKMETNCGNQ
jgi:hypothetical protein